MGILTDRFGGRIMFTVLFIASALAAAAVPLATTYRDLLFAGFFLGLAGSSFAIGVGYVSKWFLPARQGAALGIYGLGNIGQSAVIFLGPLVAARVGRDNVFYGLAALLAIWAAVFGAFARNAPASAAPARPAGALQVFLHERLSWVLSLFYFVTFGGFVAFSIYLPSLLRDDFGLTAANAGFRAAGFVVLATILRPAGGLLADKIGGARVLSGVFLGIVPFALLLSWQSIIPFTVGALGCAALMGLGNGAVFKLVPQYFPTNTGTVTGLVGAMGGLGGFFPPLVLGAFRDRLGSVWPGFFFLAGTSLVMWFLNRRVFVPRQLGLEVTLSPELLRTADKLRAGAWAAMATAMLAAAIVVGSRNLEHFDPAIAIYTFAVVFATFGVVYHYAVWLQKPPTRRFWQRSVELVHSRGFSSIPKTAATHLIAQNFIRQRSRLRWWMHQCLFWGCLSAAAITFPLVFGWIHFESAPSDQMTYVTYVFGFPVSSFALHTITAWLLFHGLDFSAVLVLAGIVLSLWRRMRDEGAIALESFSTDFFPLVILFAISVTGLALTASTLWLRGALYQFLGVLHAITVIGALLYLPFGKFFHIFQRPAQLGVKLYQKAGEEDSGTSCIRCGQRFASRMQIADLQAVLPQLGFNYALPNRTHWQALCPPCKRRSIASAQLRIKEEARNG
jgi:nitrate/nitrite transporter NarK